MNLFFSTLASATGGLIGVISAFLISKVLGREEKFFNLKEEVNFAKIYSEKLKDKFSTINIKPYIEHKRKCGEFKLKTHLQTSKERDIKCPNFYFKEYYCKYDNFYDVEKMIKKIISEPKNKSQYREPSHIEDNIWEDIFSDLVHTKLEIEESKKKNELLEKKRRNFEPQIKEINIFLILILSFFLVGIIYPISFLKYGSLEQLDYTLTNNFFFELFSTSGKITFIISILFFVFIGRVVFINNKLKFSNEQISEIKEICKYEYYSKYLKNYYENKNNKN